MPRHIRVCLYNNGDETAALAIRRAVFELTHLEVIAEVTQWDELRDCIDTGQVEMVLANLDPDLEKALQVVQGIVRLVPNMGIVGVSQVRDPESIIRAMRAGCTQFVCAPIETEDLGAAISRIQATHVREGHTSRRVCVIGSTGGVGVTTVACNLALELAHVTDRPSALVDLNLEFGDVACAFDCEPAHSLADLCRTGSELDRTVVQSAMHVLPCNVHLLARPEKVRDAHEVAPEAVEKLLALLGHTYANVVVDLPRGYSFFSAAAIERTDLVLIVTQLSVLSIRNASRIYDLLREMGANMNGVEIVLNRCKADFERVSASDVEQHFGRPPFGAIPNDFRRVMASLDLGQPILADAPKSPVRMAIQEMARKIAGELKSKETPPPPQRKGFFGRLRGKKEPARR